MMRKSLRLDEAPENLWALILAGEDGTGLQARILGSSGSPGAVRGPIEASIDGSLLRQTLDRAELAVPSRRTVIVADRTHDVHLAPEFPAPARRTPRLLLRPQGRGTATDVLLAIHWIRRQQADAAVVILPSEQVTSDPRGFMRHVVAVARFVERHAREIVLVGASPSDPDPGCGWIETAQPIPDLGRPPVWRVRSLEGSPPDVLVRAGDGDGWLRNTAVIVARAEALLEAGRRRSPELDARLETATALVGTRYERRTLEECYAVARDATFAEAVLAGTDRLLSASRLPTWPERRRTGIGRSDRPPAPRGRFDGLVEQHFLRANVEACLAKTMSPDRPWKAKPRPGIARQSSHGLGI